MVAPWRVAVLRELGQRHERVAHTQRDRSRVGCRAPHLAARVLAGEREQDLDLGVVGEARGLVEEDHAPRGIELERALSSLGEPRGDPVGVAEEETGRVDQEAAVALGHRLEARQHALREGLAYAAALLLRGGGAPPREVGRDQEHAPAGAAELDEVTRAQLTAVEAHVVRAEPLHERDGEGQRSSELGHLEEQRGPALVPVERQPARARLEPARVCLDRRERARGRVLRPCPARDRAAAEEERCEPGTEPGRGACPRA